MLYNWDKLSFHIVNTFSLAVFQNEPKVRCFERKLNFARHFFSVKLYRLLPSFVTYMSLVQNENRPWVSLNGIHSSHVSVKGTLSTSIRQCCSVIQLKQSNHARKADNRLNEKELTALFVIWFVIIYPKIKIVNNRKKGHREIEPKNSKLFTVKCATLTVICQV